MMNRSLLTQTIPATTKRPAVRWSRRGALAVMSAVAIVRPSRASEAAAAPVERLHAALLEAAAGQDGFEARVETLAPVVSAAFDFPTMSRAAVGSAWASFDDAGREALADAFAAFATANYASSFDNADGLAFSTLNVSPSERGRLLVATELARPGAPPVRFDYLVHETPNGPRIINVVVDGSLNELARRRSEFRALLDDGGLDRLLATLEERTAAAGS